MEGDEVSDGGKPRKRNKMKGWAWVEDPAIAGRLQSHAEDANGANEQTSAAASMLGDSDLDNVDIGKSSHGVPKDTERVTASVDANGMDIDAQRDQ